MNCTKIIIALFTIVMLTGLGGCKTNTDYRSLQEFSNNFNNGKYTNSEDYPRVVTHAYACQIGDSIPMSNYMNCRELAETLPEVQENYKEIYLSDSSIDVIYSKYENGYLTSQANVTREELNAFLNNLNVIAYYPSYFEIQFTEYDLSESSSKCISYRYEVNEYIITVTVEQANFNGHDYLTITKIKNGTTSVLDYDLYIHAIIKHVNE